MQNKKSRRILSVAIFILLVAVVTTSILVYNNYIEGVVHESVNATMEENVAQQAFSFSTKLDGEKDALEMLGKGLLSTPDPQNVPLEMLSLIREGTDFDYMAIAGKDGIARYPEGYNLDISGTDYYAKVMQGETVVAGPLQSTIRDERIVAIATPLLFDHQIVGVLIGSYVADELDTLLMKSFGGKGYAYVVTAEGDIVARNINDYSLSLTNNIFDVWDAATFIGHDTLSEIKEHFRTGTSGHTQYSLGDQRRMAYYMPAGINDWFIVSVVPDVVVTENADQIIFSNGLMSATFLIVFVACILYIIGIQRKNMKKLERLAYEDELTHAPTLAKFKLDAQKLLDENPDTKFVLVKNDVDKFKLLNRTLGFETGDRVLQNIVKAFQGCAFSKKFSVARFNIDEFIFMHEFVTPQKLKDQKKCYDALFLELMGPNFNYNVNFISGHYHLYQDDCRDINVAIERVNTAHRNAKTIGIPMVVYNEKLLEDALNKKEIENRMENALENNEFKVFLQPKYRLSDEEIVGAEALVRWQDGDKTYMYPGNFIPIFEDNGFILKLDMYMFENTCRFIRESIQNGRVPVPVSVNFSRLHLASADFIDNLCEIADRYEVPHHLLEIELTETAILDNEGILFETLNHLHEHGFTFSMDDFGTGYSSLGLLKNIPVDVIKIDRGFFVSADNKERTKHVLQSVIEMAKRLGIKTVAEGVETKEHIDLLRGLGCDVVQGYYYAKPMPETAFGNELECADPNQETQRKDEEE